MGISEVWTVQAEPQNAAQAPSADLSIPIPSWNTPEYPAEWPGSDEMPTVPRHVHILNYLLTALYHLLKQRGRPFGIEQDIGLHFVDSEGHGQRCDPDLIVMPFPNEGHGSLRRQDMPCPPDCVFEVASPSTVHRDLGIKKEWYAWMGVREYWVLDPVDSEDPARFASGILLPDGPLMGWRLERGRYAPLASVWDAAAHTWSAHSAVLDCKLLFVQALHGRELDGGIRIVDPETGKPIPHAREMYGRMAEKDAEIAGMVATLATVRYGEATGDELQRMMPLSLAPVPNLRLVQAWMAASSSEEFLDLARQYFGLSASER
ncbi:MAG: Uma2 family endonuclease [Caldilineaceae bacterium SB0666_bin_21]|nr:Uma2 family endonuclease [Caldilineaceae bacterium SB0666_bin_21]